MPTPTTPASQKSSPQSTTRRPTSGVTPGSPPSGTPPAGAAVSPPAVAPSPAGLPAAPAKTFRGLDEDLAEFASPQVTPPAKSAQAPPSAPPPKPAEEEGKTKTETAPPGTDQAEDYLMGPVKPKAAEEPVKTAEEAAKAEAPPAGPLKAPELRAEYAKVKKRVADLEKELSDLKAKPAEGKGVDEAERKTYVDQITGLKKQVDDMTNALKVVAYEQSSEYKSKYEQPFIEAWQEGVQLVTGLTVSNQDGNSRKGTADDFQAIMREPDNEKAADLAQEMFGSNAFYVLSQRRDIMRLHQQRVKALEEHRSNLSEREKAQEEQAQKQQEERESRRVQNTVLFKKLNADAAQAYPEYFAPIPGDDEGNAVLEKGFRNADLAFSGAPDLTNDQRVRLHSAIRNRAAAFGRVVHLLKQRDAKIAELQKDLDEIRGSTPGAGQVGRGESEGPKVLTADEEFELAAAQNR